MFRNHFQQSYTLQVQWILEPIFARMGVEMIARNFGNGGLGMIHNAMAAGDIYGHDVDMIMWDSGMTESNNTNIQYPLYTKRFRTGCDHFPHNQESIIRRNTVCHEMIDLLWTPLVGTNDKGAALGRGDSQNSTIGDWIHHPQHPPWRG